jgi:hypothetical protein
MNDFMGLGILRFQKKTNTLFVSKPDIFKIQTEINNAMLA